MWGSGTDTPSSSRSRFGARKLNNSPHKLVVKGMWVDAFFSPSDQTTEYLRRSIASTSKSMYFCVMTHTRSDLTSAMGDLVKAGKAVRGVMDNNSDQGNQFAALKANGVDVLLKKNIGGILHHKYAILDADAPPVSSDPLVITGSHNWSNSAEFANNENTLGFHSAEMAKLYLQEWYQRYKDAGGTATLVLGTDRLPDVAGSIELAQNYPNPISRSGASPYATIDMKVPEGVQAGRVVLYDALGRAVSTLFDGTLQPGSYRITLDAAALPAGIYHYQLVSGGGTLTKSMIVTR
jgi:hypothetical protein